MKKIFLSFAVTLTLVSGYAQTVNMQVYGSYVKNLNPDYKGKAFGGGLRFEFSNDESNVSYFGGVHYTAPMITKQQIEARAYDNFTDPSSVSVTAMYKLPIYRLEGGVRYYITGAAEAYEGVNFYINFGAEVGYVPNKPKYSYYDKELYTLGYSPDSDVNEDGSEKSSLNFLIAAGTGVEKNVGPGNVFLSIALGFPAFSPGDDGSDLAEFTPIPLNFNLGYKIPLSRR